MGFQIALETSSAVGGVALGYDGQLVAERDFTGDLRHAQELMPTVDALVRGANAAKDEIEWIAVSCGPGSYTGERGRMRRFPGGIFAGLPFGRVPEKGSVYSTQGNSV